MNENNLQTEVKQLLNNFLHNWDDTAIDDDKHRGLHELVIQLMVIDGELSKAANKNKQKLPKFKGENKSRAKQLNKVEKDITEINMNSNVKTAKHHVYKWFSRFYLIYYCIGKCGSSGSEI